METPPPEKRLKVAPFTIHATRGLLRDPKARRKIMASLLVVALAMILVGFLGQAWFEPREHPVGFILFWAACGWITVTALLLAVLDLLFLRAQARQARKALHEALDKESD
jgi:hypothetical protein